MHHVTVINEGFMKESERIFSRNEDKPVQLQT